MCCICSSFNLLPQVIPSVKGLDLKALKSMLKKESCYTTILTTARIRGTEKINIIDETVGTSTSRVNYVIFSWRLFRLYEFIDLDFTVSIYLPLSSPFFMTRVSTQTTRLGR